MKPVELNVPILLLAFNRPAQTNRVFEAIRQVRPKKLYVAVDAPRENRDDDVIQNNKVKSIVENVDWPCETHYLYQEKNLGCSKSGLAAWKWAFQTEDSVIFVEDDGLGTPDAFYFIQQMLEKYKDDNRIAYVGSVNYGLSYGNASYFFSRCPAATYFMGTWKRVFELYEYDLESYEHVCKDRTFKKRFLTMGEFFVRNQAYKSYVHSIKTGNRHNTYDVQMSFLSYNHNMYSIHPNVNLVSNIGLDGGANNAVDVNSSFYKEYANRATSELSVVVDPKEFCVDKNFERIYFRKRSLYNKPWVMVWLKIYLLQHFGTFYKKYIKRFRR